MWFGVPVLWFWTNVSGLGGRAWVALCVVLPQPALPPRGTALAELEHVSS